MQDHGRLTAVHISKHSPSHHVETLKITVGCPPCACPSMHTKTCRHDGLHGNTRAVARADARACLNLHHSDIQGTARKLPCVNTCGGHREKKSLSLSGSLGRTHSETGHTGQRTREKTEGRCDMMKVVFFLETSTRSSAVHQAQCDAALQVRHRSRGMSISSGSGGASGMGASSSSSAASAIAHSTGSSGAGSGSMCLEKRSSREWSAAASSTASLKWASLWARKRRHPVVHALFSSQRSVTAKTGFAMLCSWPSLRR